MAEKKSTPVIGYVILLMAIFQATLLYYGYPFVFRPSLIPSEWQEVEVTYRSGILDNRYRRTFFDGPPPFHIKTPEYKEIFVIDGFERIYFPVKIFLEEVKPETKLYILIRKKKPSGLFVKNAEKYIWPRGLRTGNKVYLHPKRHKNSVLTFILKCLFCLVIFFECILLWLCKVIFFPRPKRP
jgi:hypothetical protein